MDRLHDLEQHDRVRLLLLEGELPTGLEGHVSTCPVCGRLAARLADLGRLIRDVPEPRPELFQEILRPRRAPTGPAGRIEMLWPDGPSPASATLLPLVLAVDADRRKTGAARSAWAEHLVVLGRSPITIGRGPDMDLPIWDRSVSRRHARIDWRDDGWVVRDLESTNGTRLNGAKVSATGIAFVKPGDEIEVGHGIRLAVRGLLPVPEAAGVARELIRLLAWTSDPTRPDAPDEGRSGDLRARLRGLREETVRLRDQLSEIARQGADAEAFPQVYERLANMLALIEHDGFPSVRGS
ncbi:MAG TPA: FHA domain-containing protein [Candidatus Dormibacteraeota bacterium]|nr:FHA domain-containing protein [Candidatus Dormibacteraeota bacterium]